MFLFFMWIGSSLDLMFFCPEGVQEMERSKCYEEPNGDTQLASRGGAVHLKNSMSNHLGGASMLALSLRLRVNLQKKPMV